MTMHRKILFTILTFLVCAGAAFTGCSTVPGIPPSTTMPTTVPTTAAPVTPVTTVTPRPMVTDSVPPQYSIDVSIDKDRVYNTITVTFNGGPGQVFVQRIQATVTSADGAVTTKDIPFTGQISGGASVQFEGTKGQDRVEVYATINGQTYKIKDEYVYLPSY